PVDGKADEEQQEKGRPDELQHWREKAGKTTRSQRDDRRSDQQQVEDGSESGAKSNSTRAKLRLVSASYIVLWRIHDNAKGSLQAITRPPLRHESCRYMNMFAKNAESSTTCCRR